MADGSFPGLVSRNRDVNADDNVVFTGITDDAGNLVSVTGNKLDVNADVTVGSDHVYVDDSAFVVAVDHVAAVGMLADETTPDSVDEGDIGIPRMTLDRLQLNRIVGSTDANRWEIDGSGLGQVDVAAHALTNANAWPVSRDNAANTELNPIVVHTTNTVLSGNEIHDYDTAAAVVSDASDNHDYVVTGTTFLLKSVIVAGSGNIKFEVQTGPDATLATVAVGFLTGRQGDTKQLFFDPSIEVPVTGTGTVRIIRTNRQGSATDLYSTIIGNDVA